MHSNQDDLPGVSTVAVANDANTKSAVELIQRLRRAVKATLEEHVEALENEHSWALLNAMQQRASEHAMGCVALYSHGYYAPAEALCRTVVETAVNLYYCSGGDSLRKFLNYFKSHIDKERQQNRNWASSVKGSKFPDHAKADHLKRIANKDEAMNSYELVVTEAFGQLNLSYASSSATWPSIFDRFKAIDKEVAYRTVYAGLCSQTHNDAEDLLNDFVHGVSQVDGAHEAQAFENENFSLYMVLTALAFLIEATWIYLAKFNFDVTDQFQTLLADTWTEIERVTKRVSGLA